MGSLPPSTTWEAQELLNGVFFYSTDIFSNVEYISRAVLGFGIIDLSKSLDPVYLFLRLKDFSLGG